jgi:molybdopterin converting factor small subunit
MAILIPHTSLAKLLGERTVRSSAGTVGELLEEVGRRLPPDEWDKARRCIVLVNGRAVHLVKGMDTPVGPDDEVWMVHPACGG